MNLKVDERGLEVVACGTFHFRCWQWFATKSIQFGNAAEIADR